MTKKIKEYLNAHEHKQIIDSIYERASLPKNKGDKMTDLQFISLMGLISSQIISGMAEYKEIYDKKYTEDFLKTMKECFTED